MIGCFQTNFQTTICRWNPGTVSFLWNSYLVIRAGIFSSYAFDRHDISNPCYTDLTGAFSHGTLGEAVVLCVFQLYFWELKLKRRAYRTGSLGQMCVYSSGISGCKLTIKMLQPSV